MNIDIRPVTASEYENTLKWISTFHAPPAGRYEIKTVLANNNPIGYFELVRTPVLMMGWKHGHGREVVTAIRTLKAASQLEWGECLALSDPKSDIYKHLNRIGFESTNLELVRGI